MYFCTHCHQCKRLVYVLMKFYFNDWNVIKLFLEYFHILQLGELLRVCVYYNLPFCLLDYTLIYNPKTVNPDYR